LSYSYAQFDHHILASKRKIARQSRYTTSVEDIRLKMVDIFVCSRWPRDHLKADFELALIDALEGRETDSNQVGLIKQILHFNKEKCAYCNLDIKFNQVVTVIFTHDQLRKVLEKPSQKESLSHVFHNHCAMRTLQSIIQRESTFKLIAGEAISGANNQYKVPMENSTCYCSKFFDLNAEKELQNIMVNLVNQHYDTNVWQMSGDVGALDSGNGNEQEDKSVNTKQLNNRSASI